MDTVATEKQNKKPAAVFSWHGILSPLIYWPMVLIVTVGLFLPAAWVEESKQLNRLFVTLAELAPFAFTHANSTLFRSIASLGTVILWTSIIYGALIYAYIFLTHYFSEGGYERALSANWGGVRNLAFMGFASVLCLGSTSIFTFLQGDSSLYSGMTTGSRFGYTLILLIAYWLSSLSSGLLISSIAVAFHRMIRSIWRR
jgi:hypothetical protein